MEKLFQCGETMNAFLEQAQMFEPSSRQFIPDNGGSPLASRNAAASHTQQSTGPVRLDSEAGDTFTASSNPVRHDNRAWPTLPGFPWLDARFDRPCAITSPLNDI